MAKKIKIGKNLTALTITILVFLTITVLHILGVFQNWENLLYDARVRFWANSIYSRPSDEIIVIVVDEDSLAWAQQERGWGWPWPRQAFAEIVDYMNISGAKSVAFDINFPAPSLYRSARQDELIDSAVRSLEEAQAAAADGQMRSMLPLFRNIADSLNSLNSRGDDESFIRASRNFSNVVQVVMFSSTIGNDSFWPASLNVPLFQPENFGSMLQKFSIGENEKALFPFQGLRDSAGALGCVTGVPDSDGIMRRIRPFTLFDGKAVPGLSAASLIVSGKGRRLSYDSKTRFIEWEGVSIPVNSAGKALLRYRGKIDRYQPYKAVNILLSAEAHARGEEILETEERFTKAGTRWQALTPSNFKDTYVFFGVYAEGLYDIYNTPMGPFYPGMGCHVTMLDNMLQNDFIHESSLLLNLIILFALVVLSVFTTMFVNRIPIEVGGMLFIIAVIITGAFLAYQFAGLWLPMVAFIAGILAAFITTNLYNYATEGSQKRFIKSAFSQYLSPKVIDQIIADPSQLKLGGEKREMTAIFSDIRAFSTISEVLGDPAKLVELLNFYLTKMSDIVLNNQGTIDKYEGDAIIAFFGAPVHFNNHASLACRAAVKMKRAEREINREALALGLITPEVMNAMAKKGIISGADDPYPVFTRIGLNTGDMVVGNMGTPNKMDYTIMGNAVNLAARLEGVNKQYDTGGILISEFTKEHIGDEFILRPLSRARVVGINTPIRLYELLDIASEAAAGLVDMVKEWERAFGLYEKKEFSAAAKIFQAVYKKNGRDLTAKKYFYRCARNISSPPDDKTWDDGVDNLTEK